MKAGRVNYATVILWAQNRSVNDRFHEMVQTYGAPLSGAAFDLQAHWIIVIQIIDSATTAGRSCYQDLL
jgi:hypothetical protein